METNNAFAADLREMMTNWNRIRAAALREFPCASAEKINAITAAAFEHSLGMKKAR